MVPVPVKWIRAAIAFFIALTMAHGAVLVQEAQWRWMYAVIAVYWTAYGVSVARGGRLGA